MKRLIKAGWFMSLFVATGLMLYFYAGLPNEVSYGSEGVSFLSKETYFYLSLFIIAFCNFSLYGLSRNMRYKNEEVNDSLINWQLSFAMALNFFFLVFMAFIFLVNSQENFNYDHFGFLIYIALALILGWVIALPIILIRKKSQFN